VGYGELSRIFEFMPGGIVPEKTAVGGADWPVGCFHIAHQKYPLSHVYCAGRIACIGVVCMVGVVVVETTQKNFLSIGLIIAVSIQKEDHIRPLRYIDAFRCKFESHRQV